jgi:hypothetical protein
MFGPSVKSRFGWSVTIVPRLIGVPVAATPGFVPHSEVLALAWAVAPPVVPPLAWPELDVLPHPARTPTATAAIAAAPNLKRRCSDLFMVLLSAGDKRIMLLVTKGSGGNAVR